MQVGGGTALGDWTLLYANDQWSDAVGGVVEPPAAFWEHFKLVQDLGREEADAAVAEGRPFTLNIVDKEGSELRMDFRPAATDQIAAHMPLIGIPGTIRSKRVSGPPRANADGAAPIDDASASFWFAIVRHRRASMDRNGSSGPATPSPYELAQQAAVLRAASGGSSLSPSSTSVPGGFPTIAAYVPAALSGITINSIALGTGAGGSRVYRGLYGAQQVAVKVVERSLPSGERLPPALIEALSPQIQHPSVVPTLLYAVEQQEVGGW